MIATLNALRIHAIFVSWVLESVRFLTFALAWDASLRS